MLVTELPPAETAKMVERFKPVITKHAATIGAEVVTDFLAAAETAKK
jgi:TRAP-type transport system periplasmic protein